MNKVIIIGNLGGDPEVRETETGTAVANFNLATSDKWLDKAGAKQERTEWHRVVIFGKLAENCAKYLKKGSQCMVEGRIQSRKWKDKEGNDRYTTEIVAMAVKFLDPSSKSKSQDDAATSFEVDAAAFFEQ